MNSNRRAFNVNDSPADYRLESEAQDAVMLALGAMPGRVVIWRNAVVSLPNPNGGGFMRGGLIVGSSDLIGVVVCNGRFLAIEMKRKRGKEREAQILFRNLVNRSNGYACVCRCVSEALAAVAAAERGEVAV